MKWHYKPVVFIHFPRAGGTFIRDYIKELNDENFIYFPKHLPATDIKKPNEYYKFGLIRNPFDWYLSSYYYYIQKPTRRINKAEKGILESMDAKLRGSEFFSRFPTIDDFIQWGFLANRPSFWFSYLYNHFFCDRGRLAVDYVGRLENIYDELDFVMGLNNISSRLDLRSFGGNRNTAYRPKHHFCYNKRSRDIIWEKDREIFESYGYKY